MCFYFNALVFFLPRDAALHRTRLQAEDEEPFVYPDLFPDEEDESKDTSGSS